VDGNVKSLSDDVKHFFIQKQKSLEDENNMLKEDKKKSNATVKAMTAQIKKLQEDHQKEKKRLATENGTTQAENSRLRQENGKMSINTKDRRLDAIEAELKEIKTYVKPTAAIMPTTAVVPTASQAMPTAVVQTASQAAAKRIMRPSQSAPQGVARK
jgi:hypothetical protein